MTYNDTEVVLGDERGGVDHGWANNMAKNMVAVEPRISPRDHNFLVGWLMDGLRPGQLVSGEHLARQWCRGDGAPTTIGG